MDKPRFQADVQEFRVAVERAAIIPISYEPTPTVSRQSTPSITNMAANFSEAQRNEMAGIIAQAMTLMNQHQQQQPGAMAAKPPQQFRPRDIGYFDPNPDTMPVEPTISTPSIMAYPVRTAIEATPANMAEYRPSHIDAQDAIAFAALKMKDQYDSKHSARFFEVGDLVNLRLHHGYRVPGITSKKVGPQLVGPFRVLERIGRLAYRLELPDTMRIHNVISVAHLEPATDPEADPYRRRRLPAPAVVVDGYEEFEIEKLLQKRRIRRGRGWSTQYLVRWLGYGPEYDEWMPDYRLSNASELISDFEKVFGMTSGL